MSRGPQPRPALQKAPEGSTHPAAPKAAATKQLHPAPHAPATEPASDGRALRQVSGKNRKAGKGGAPGKEKVKKADLVRIEVEIPKKVRKAARKKAEAEGWTFDQAVTYVLRAWTDG